jgi:molecular chaperone DnaK
MKNVAKTNEATDKAAKEKVEKLNAADSLVFQTEKQLKEYGDKIPADKKTTIETAVNKLKEAHKAQDIAAIDSSMTELNNAWTAASQDIYNAQQQQSGAQQPGGGAEGGQQQQQAGGNAENVQDVPFEEVK